MNEPAYKQPFDQTDFRGYFRWSAGLSRRLAGKLYHACHEDELEEIINYDELDLRSKWSLKLPKHGLWSANGIWTGLNYFLQGNLYGPCLIKFPIEVLNGKHFMVFRRKGSDRHRHFFIQYEAQIPIYSFGKETWRTVKPNSYFTSRDKMLIKKPGAIYDIVLTQPLPLNDVEIIGVNHPKCISRKCKGSSVEESNKIVQRLAVADWAWTMSQSSEYHAIMNRFPILNGKRVKLFDPSGKED